MTACTAFLGHRRLVSGPLPDVALAVKRALQAGSPDPILIYDDRTGRDFDLDTRGTDAEMIGRLAEAPGAPAEPAAEIRGRGRPRLGVVAREITLLPRHWEWLSEQPGGASVALRKLVETASRTNVDKDRARRARDAAYYFISSIAGNFPGFEEASRALFANDRNRFAELMAAWPEDIRAHALALASAGGV